MKKLEMMLEQVKVAIFLKNVNIIQNKCLAYTEQI